MNSNMYGNVDSNVNSNVDGENKRWLRKFLLALADVMFILLAGIVLIAISTNDEYTSFMFKFNI